VKLLEKVTFQKELGSYAEKSERVQAIFSALTNLVELRGVKINPSSIHQAPMLAKTDLTTELVKEFTELQGIIGGLYAAKQGIHPATAEAIYDQYLPASASDSIPRSAEGWLLGLSDRIDTIRGMFSLGMEPTGSKDPFGLRRAANAIVRILAESSLPLKLSEVIKASSPLPEVEAKMTAFFAERIDFYLRDGRNQSYDVVKASMAAGSDDLRDLVARAEAVTAVRGSEDFLAVSAAFKRMKNILAQSTETGDLQTALSGGGGAVHPAQAALWGASEQVEAEVTLLNEKREYVAALERIATLRPVVDRFFEEVMILDPNPDVRSQRLAVLFAIVSNIRKIADLSEIVTAG
jgi:glycyl-tRNA synthetase beta chain